MPPCQCTHPEHARLTSHADAGSALQTEHGSGKANGMAHSWSFSSAAALERTPALGPAQQRYSRYFLSVLAGGDLARPEALTKVGPLPCPYSREAAEPISGIIRATS